MAEAARGYLARDPAGAKVEIVEGDARETILALENGFDLVYVDADKVGYPAYVEAALTLLQPRGLVVIDNLLMDGAVASGRETATGRRPRWTLGAVSATGSPTIRRSTSCSCRSATGSGWSSQRT